MFPIVSKFATSNLINRELQPSIYKHLIRETMNELMKRLDRLEVLTLLAAKSVLNLDDVVLLTGLSKSTLYKKTANRELPYYRANGGKQIFFKKEELEDWLTKDRVSSQNEDEAKAVNEYFCQKVKAGKGGLK